MARALSKHFKLGESSTCQYSAVLNSNNIFSVQKRHQQKNIPEAKPDSMHDKN